MMTLMRMMRITRMTRIILERIGMESLSTMKKLRVYVPHYRTSLTKWSIGR
jgi:hypothetical protein